MRFLITESLVFFLIRFRIVDNDIDYGLAPERVCATTRSDNIFRLGRIAIGSFDIIGMVTVSIVASCAFLRCFLFFFFSSVGSFNNNNNCNSFLDERHTRVVNKSRPYLKEGFGSPDPPRKIVKDDVKIEVKSGGL